MQIVQVLFGFLLFCTRTGKRLLFGPLHIYRAFAGTESLHWTEWLAHAVAVGQAWRIAFILIGPRDPLGDNGPFGVFLALTGCFIVAWVVGGMCKLLEKVCITLSQFPALRFLLWCPGNKQLRLWLLGRTPAAAPAPLFTGSASGAAKHDEKLVRGTAIVDGGQLGANMKQGVTPDDLARLIEWGGVPVLHHVEPEHFLISGKTGSGKTQAINEILRKVRLRAQSAIIADPAGGFLSRFGQAGDLVLNPFDARSQVWSPFNEIEAEYDCHNIAASAVPEGEGEGKAWHHYAQSLLAETMIAMYRVKDFSLKKLLDYVMNAQAAELHELLAGTSADILTFDGNEKMLSNTRAIIASYLAPWRSIPDGGTFSVRRWVRDSDKNRSWLFITYRDDQMKMMRNLVSCWLDLAITEGLCLSESRDRRLWFIMDELDSLGRVSNLRLALTKLRKYGGVCVAGLQTIAQLRDTYGRDGAQSLLGNMSNKLVLTPGDGETAKYFEEGLGVQEVERWEESESQGVNSSMQGYGQNQGTSKALRRVTQPAVLASELMSLPNRHGYLRLSELKPLARVEVQYVPMNEINLPFVPKEAAQ